MSLHASRRRWRSALRQLLYPRDLRIAAPVWPAGLVAALEQLARDPAPERAPEQATAPAVERAYDERLFAEVATGLFRARQAIQAGAEPQRPRAQRHVESAVGALAGAGIEILDPTGRPYDTGLIGLEVIAFEDTPGIARETVVETIRPGVYINGRCVQESQVVVGVPARADGLDGAGQPTI